MNFKGPSSTCNYQANRKDKSKQGHQVNGVTERHMINSAPTSDRRRQGRSLSAPILKERKMTRVTISNASRRVMTTFNRAVDIIRGVINNTAIKTLG